MLRPDSRRMEACSMAPRSGIAATVNAIEIAVTTKA